jgi:MFS transporter, ACS family, aldohexuronate transporter
MNSRVEPPAAMPASISEVDASPPAPAGGAALAAVQAVTERIGHYRWVICGLLFFATTINYVDRQVIGLLAKELQTSIGWNEQQYGNIVAAFNGAYALGLLFSGKLMDRFGTKIGYTISIVVWSFAGVITGLARTPFQFGMARAALGLGESGNFPAAIKTVAEWFPKKERALATGIFNAGTNLGAIVAPLTVPWIALHMGWQWAFILTGAIGLLWLALWLPIYRKPDENPRLTSAERAYIQSDPPDPVAKISWIKLVPHRQTCSFAIGKYLTDPIWWFYLYWIANFLRDKYGLSLNTVGLPVVAIYLIADVGSVGGGWLSSSLLKRGWSVNRARKTAMLFFALLVVPVIFAPQVSSLWGAVALIGLATAAHQGWSANIFTTASDMFPRRAVGSVVGIGGMAGAVGGATLAVVTGYMLDSNGGNYQPVFYVAGFAYLAALGVIQILAPQLRPVEDVDATLVRPLSVGAIVGFGFIGLMFGTFGGWVLGLIAGAAGAALLGFMIKGAILAAVAGAVAGMIVCRTFLSKESSAN